MNGSVTTRSTYSPTRLNNKKVKLKEKNCHNIRKSTSVNDQHLTVHNLLNAQTVDITRDVMQRLSEKVYNYIV